MDHCSGYYRSMPTQPSGMVESMNTGVPPAGFNQQSFNHSQGSGMIPAVPAQQGGHMPQPGMVQSQQYSDSARYKLAPCWSITWPCVCFVLLQVLTMCLCVQLFFFIILSVNYFWDIKGWWIFLLNPPFCKNVDFCDKWFETVCPWRI